MKNKSIITGAAILTLSGIATRLIGFYYRIFMTKTMGSEGIGLYQLIMPIYILAWTITSSGITTTVSTMTAKTTAAGNHRESLNILKTALMLTGILSIIVEAALLIFSPFTAEKILNDIRAVSSLRVIALCFPFMSMGSSIRGYFYGTQNTSIPAISQIIEQLVRVLSVITIFTFYKPVSLASACAVTAVGITLGEIVSFIYTLLSFYKFKKEIPLQKGMFHPTEHLPAILSSAVPLSSGRILGSFLSTAENILIPQMLLLYGYTESNALSVYGKLTGMAMPMIQFPTAVLMSFSTALAPAISASNIRENSHIKHTIEKSLLFSSVMGIWALTVFIFFPKQVSFLLYNQSSLGSMVIRLAPLCPFIYTGVTLSGILNGLGKQKIIFLNNMLSSFINLVTIYTLMPIYGIYTFIFSMFISLFLTTSISLFVIIKATDIRPSIVNLLLKPLVCSVSTGIIAKFIPLFHSFSKPSIIISITAISILYFSFTILTGSVELRDITSLIPHKKRQASK